jgi:hypothetical protein
MKGPHGKIHGGKNLNSRGVMVGFLLFYLLSVSCTFAETLYKSRDLTIESLRLGEGNYEITLIRNAGQRETIWKSFFGNVTIKVSSDERFIALLDSMKFDVMSPVIVYRIETNAAVPIYQTPCKFSQEDTSFTYRMGKFGKDEFEVQVFSTIVSETLHNRQTLAFGYYVKGLKNRPRMVPYFYMDVSGLKEFGDIPEIATESDQKGKEMNVSGVKGSTPF